MKALVTTDGSAHALAALREFIARLPWFAHAPSIELITVHPSLPYGRAAAWAGKENVARYYEEEMQEVLAPALAVFAEHGIVAATIRRIGEPAREIVKYAKESGVDLIVMGTRGQSEVSTLLLGSNAQKVLSLTTVPVLLLK